MATRYSSIALSGIDFQTLQQADIFLCNLCVLCVSVVYSKFHLPQRHREHRGCTEKNGILTFRQRRNKSAIGNWKLGIMKIAVAMSGGVDSSAAAAILKEQGHELVGFTMQLWDQRRGINVDENGDPLPSRCCSLDDVYDARRVAEELDFPFYVLNLERDFERDVVHPFVTSYLNGETPIPCVTCNSRLKFASLDRLALSLGCEKVATGHYARVEFHSATNRYKLLRGKNQQKDQSYFLWELTQAQLSRALFPLGEMSKPEARAAARQHGLSGVSEKKESQEICFVPDGDYAGFIDRYLEYENATERLRGAGEIVDTSGRVIGHHEGIHRYTIGQRRGMGIANERALYVISIDAD